jgi:HlyD family secretion protein
MAKILSFLKGRKYLYGVVAVILIIAGLFIFKNGKTTNQTISINHSDFINKVSVSGKVVAAEDVDLSFKNEGRIERIYFSVGGTVKEGALIAKIDAKDAEKAVHDAETSLASAKLDLEKIKLQNSNINLNSDLQKAYDDGFTAVSDAFLDFLTTINGLEDILAENNVSDNTARFSGETALDYRDEAEKLYYKAENIFEKNRKSFRLLDRSSTKQEIEVIIDETYETAKIFSNAIKSVKNLVDYLADDTNRASEYVAYQTSLSLFADAVGEHLSSLLSIKTDIKDYKDAFSNTDLNIEDSLLSIKQKENTLQDAKNRLSDYYIRAPFEGIITKIDAKVGEMAAPNVPLITMMSAGTFQIESFVPEVNIAQIKMGDEAQVTLDAYGETVTFGAIVISIDPAETIRDGVSTYKIKLQFRGDDSRIKSGMTASVTIVTFSKLNVIVIPGGVVFDKEGKKFVQVKINEKISDVEVVLGAISSLGQVEVVSGLEDGDMVILNPNVGRQESQTSDIK